MIQIPAGDFIYQNGERLSLPTFYIDEFEVTIGQYAEFLRFLEQHPEAAAKFEHPSSQKASRICRSNGRPRSGDWTDAGLLYQS